MAKPDRHKLVDPPKQAVAYLWPETYRSFNNVPGGDVFTFQYWPDTLTDGQSAEYSPKTIPGGSHPLYQYVGGGERNISFSAVFTSELADPGNSDPDFLSSRFTVDVRSAIARIESFKLPSYPKNGANGRVLPPPKLVLTFPGTNLGRVTDQVIVILKDVSWSYTSWFPDGVPRVATTELSFSEIVQRTSAGGSNIKFIGREIYKKQLLSRYNRTHSRNIK